MCAIHPAQGELIFEMVSETDTTITVRKPLVLVVHERGAGFMPFSFMAMPVIGGRPDMKADITLTINKSQLLCVPFTPNNQDMVNNYLSTTSEIMVQPKSIIMG